MKTALLVLVLLFHCCMCYAQGTNPKRDGICADKNCIDLELPYMFCDENGKHVVKCSKNPNNERGLKFMKVQLPIMFNYTGWTLQPHVTGGDGIIKFYEGFDTNFVGHVVFNAANMEQIIAAAARRWSSSPDLCPPQGPNDEYPPCVIQIRWSISNDDFAPNTLTTSAAVTRRVWNPRECRVDCSQSYIALNQQLLFLRPDAYGRPTHFLGTERDKYQYIPPEPGYHYTDAYTALLHEFGHWLGFPHTNEAPCGDPSGIMKPKWQSRETGELSWADMCQFLKAYCCEKTQTTVYVPTDPCPTCPPEDHTKPNISGSTDNGTDIGFTAVPNPATAGIVNVAIYGTCTTGSVSIRVVNASGNVVLSRQLYDVAKTRELTIDVSSFSTGVYMLQILDGDRIFGRKIIISER